MEEEKKFRKSEESRLQTEAFVWLWNTYPETRGLFFTVMNETNPRHMNRKEQVILGAIRRMRGVVAGVSDGVLLMPNGKYHFCCAEAKTTSANSRQSDAQKEFQRRVESVGGYYFIYRTLDEFKKEMGNYLFDNKS